ncbi:MAG: Uma2 family endonuclease [Calothrix sp. MO_192.B10]|nr:Uma2 family endonuclease [Calothrix sp. MO_192.B10]
MTAQIGLEQSSQTQEQHLILPGSYNWQQFKTIQAIIEEQAGVRISYLDGVIEIMTIGEGHEIVKSLIALLLGLYFFQKQIEFIPVGSATRESEEKGVSFEPDESYYIGEKKDNPDLAIEVNITSGSPKKLEKYQRFKISEVWLWSNNQIAVYCLRDVEDEDKIRYEQVCSSQLLPDLDLSLLVRCVLMSSKLEAMNEFMKAIKSDII